MTFLLGLVLLASVAFLLRFLIALEAEKPPTAHWKSECAYENAISRNRKRNQERTGREGARHIQRGPIAWGARYENRSSNTCNGPWCSPATRAGNSQLI